MGYFAAIAMGLVLGALGGGGSILTVPTLVYLFHLPAMEATAYSLFIVGVSSAIGSIGYFRSGLVDWKTGFIFSLPAFVGVYGVRRYLLPALPELIFSFDSFSLTKDQLILGTFALVMLAASIPMIRGNKTPETAAAKAPRKVFLAIQGIVVGSITGFVGAGGGFVIVPGLVLLAGLTMTVAVGTSLLIIAMNSLIGFMGDLQTLSEVDWAFLMKFTGLAVFGILFGKMMASKIPAKTLKKGFGVFVLVMGFVILFLELNK